MCHARVTHTHVKTTKKMPAKRHTAAAAASGPGFVGPVIAPVPFQRDTLLLDPATQWLPHQPATALVGAVHPLPVPSDSERLTPLEMENALQLLPPPPPQLLARLRRLLAKKGMSHLLRRSRYQHLVQTWGQGMITAAWLTLLLAPSMQRSNLC